MPNEEIPYELANSSLRFRHYDHETWSKLFNIRQKLALITLSEKIKEEFGKKPLPPSQPPITPPEAPKELIHKISLKVKIPWDKLSEVFRGVFRPLSEEGAEVSPELKIDATSRKGIKRDTFELRIKETLNQIGVEVEEERVE